MITKSQPMSILAVPPICGCLSTPMMSVIPSLSRRKTETHIPVSPAPGRFQKIRPYQSVS
jgi:hypothetical protein